MPPRSQVGECLETRDHDIASKGSRRSGCRSFGKLEATIPPEYAFKVPFFGKLQTIKLIESASAMPDWETSGKLEVIILPEYGSELLGWDSFGNHKAIILPEYTSELPGWKTFGNIQVMILPEYASEMPS